MKSMTFDELEQIVEANGKLDGWDFSRVRAGRDPVRFTSIFLASGFSCSQALSTPTHTQVTQAWELQLTGQCGKVLLKPGG